MSAMLKKPLVSIIMPMYNTKRYVGAAIESILNQKERCFEFIIVDDGSTDGSIEIVRKYAQRDPRIVVISRPRTGIVGVLNDGIARCRTGLIARMDADDVAEPSRLSEQIAFIGVNPNCVVAGTWALHIDPSGWPITTSTPPQTHEKIEQFHLTGAAALLHPTVIMRREAVRAVGGYRECVANTQDYDLWLRLGELGELQNIPRFLLQYRERFDSLTVTPGRWQKKLQDKEVALREACHRRGIDYPGITFPYFPARRTDIRLAWAGKAIQSQYYPTALKHSFIAVCFQPWNVHAWKMLRKSVRMRYILKWFHRFRTAA